MTVVADIRRLSGDIWMFYRYFEIRSESDLSLAIDMFDGTKVLDFEGLYAELEDSDMNVLTQEYTLYQTYIKFGETQQDVITFKVKLQKYRFQMMYLLKRFWYFKLLRKIDRGKE